MKNSAILTIAVTMLCTTDQPNRSTSGMCEDPPGETYIEHERFFVVRVPESEGYSHIICFRSAAGDVSMRGPFAGEAVFLEGANRILVVGLSAHHQIDQTLVFNLTGQQIVDISHGELAGYGSSRDDMIFWLYQFYIEDAIPMGRVTVYNYNGETVLQQSFMSKTSVAVDFEGRTYSIALPAPDFPG